MCIPMHSNDKLGGVQATMAKQNNYKHNDSFNSFIDHNLLRGHDMIPKSPTQG
jgi:hypothetical protein